MKKQIRILLTGALVMIPFAVTIYVIFRVGTGLEELGRKVLPAEWADKGAFGLGILIILAAIYVVGLLAKWWIFGWALGLLEKLMGRVPGVKTIYESVRDLLQLFGGDAKRMGKAVLYTQPGTQMTMLAILTNETPAGIGPEGARDKVAIYLPYSYMFGGITVYVPRESLKEIDTSVEEALKLCATAQVSTTDDAGSGGAAKGR